MPTLAIIEFYEDRMRLCLPRIALLGVGPPISATCPRGIAKSPPDERLAGAFIYWRACSRSVNAEERKTQAYDPQGREAGSTEADGGQSNCHRRHH